MNGQTGETAGGLCEFLHSTGGLIVIMLVGETRMLPEEIGDKGSEDTRLVTLLCRKTVIPYLLAVSADSRRNDGVGRLSVWSLASSGRVIKGVVCNEVVEVSVVV